MTMLQHSNDTGGRCRSSDVQIERAVDSKRYSQAHTHKTTENPNETGTLSILGPAEPSGEIPALVRGTEYSLGMVHGPVYFILGHRPLRQRRAKSR